MIIEASPNWLARQNIQHKDILMGVMKRISTQLHNNGEASFNSKPKHERGVIKQILRDRHLPVRRQEVIGDYIVMLGEMVKEPLVEGYFIAFDPLTETQRFVRVYQENSSWYALEAGSTIRNRLDHFNQPYFRWVQIHPLDKDVLRDLRRR
jgi:hypothetical protein